MESQGNFAYSIADFHRVQEIARAEAGIYLPLSKRNLVFSRVSRRIRATGQDSFRSYLDYVTSKAGQAELQELICVLTTNVTQFFREKVHFDHLQQELLPSLATRLRHGGRGRLWSAACSTGQEPWSMAMSVLSTLPDALHFDMKILATDINHAVVETGRRGEYWLDDLHGVSVHWRERYMDTISADKFIIDEEVRRLVTFRSLNLNKPWPFHGQFDAIFCRNVVIYFDDETRNALWQRLAERLVPGGFLYVGHSERVDALQPCRLEVVAPTIYRKKD